MIERVRARDYRDLEARRSAETDEEGAAEAHRKIGTVGPDDEVTATGVDTTGQEATAPASEVAVVAADGTGRHRRGLCPEDGGVDPGGETPTVVVVARPADGHQTGTSGTTVVRTNPSPRITHEAWWRLSPHEQAYPIIWCAWTAR